VDISLQIRVSRSTRSRSWLRPSSRNAGDRSYFQEFCTKYRNGESGDENGRRSHFARATSDRVENARDILNAAGFTGGVIVHVGCGSGELTVGLCQGENTIVQGPDTSTGEVAVAHPARLDTESASDQKPCRKRGNHETLSGLRGLFPAAFSFRGASEVEKFA